MVGRAQMYIFAVAVLGGIGCLWTTGARAAETEFAKWSTVHNDFFWTDDKGDRILTRSGCLCQFNGMYYWYGGNPRGFREQYCYTSKDLMHWTNQGVVLRHDVDANRIDVLFNERTKKYVMFLKYNGNGAHFAVATAEKPEGPFTFNSQTLVDNALMGDMSIYKDADGTAYLAYVSWAVGTNAQHGIYRMSEDYLSLDERVYLWNIGGREAPHIFTREGTYYYGTSRTAWIESTGTNYYSAKDLTGPWSAASPLRTPGSTNSWDSQVDFVIPIHGTKGTVYMFAGDRWTKDLPKGRNGDYVWLPMEFVGEVPTVNYYQDWELNLTEGTWRKFDASRNLARGRTATASSTVGSNVANNVTAGATYENYVTRQWESEAQDPQWVMVDLGDSMEINRVILKWGASAARAFKIQASVDQTTWKDLYSSTTGSSYSATDVTFDTTKARYVRMYGTALQPAVGAQRGGRGAETTRAPSGYCLYDFEVLKD